MYSFKEYLYMPEADNMPFIRWHAYMLATALSLGYHGRFSIGTHKGKSYIKIFEYENSRRNTLNA